MPNRRDILQQTCALALAVTSGAPLVPAARAASSRLPYGLRKGGAPSAVRRDETILRAPIGAMLDRRAHEYFGGRYGNGAARWVRDIEARAVVHTFPRGWVKSTNLFPGDLVVEPWLPSVVYNESLGLYLMASAGIGCAADGSEFGKPSYLGFWVSEAPLGVPASCLISRGATCRAMRSTPSPWTSRDHRVR